MTSLDDSEVEVRRADGGLVLPFFLRSVPVFPLPDAVLLPFSLMPLHIFELRYRKMTRDALAGPRLLVIARQTGGEDEETRRPAFAPIAGLGEIVMAEKLAGGKYNLVIRGCARVRIVEELATEGSYRMVRVVPIPDDPVESRELADADGSLRALADQLAGSLPEGGGLLRQIVAAQTTPQELVSVMAASAIADADTRQRLLETTNVLTRFENVASELVAMQSRISTPGRGSRVN